MTEKKLRIFSEGSLNGTTVSEKWRVSMTSLISTSELAARNAARRRFQEAILSLADKLSIVIGASPASAEVDWASEDWQIGQTTTDAVAPISTSPSKSPRYPATSPWHTRISACAPAGRQALRRFAATMPYIAVPAAHRSSDDSEASPTVHSKDRCCGLVSY
ncbi:hypothetical protein [Mesorhizobium sp. M0323]|uniref:hypothetical protein n=1 Tax=Mesorhizobium sp. M0323 TaxID=2956938 RepID=UPI00333781BF